MVSPLRLLPIVRSLALLTWALLVVASATTLHAQQRVTRAGGAPPPDRVSLASPVVTLPLEAEGKPRVSVTINGKGPFQLIFDTGASGSLIAQSVFEQLGLPALGEARMGRPGGEAVPATVTRIERLNMGGVTIEGLTVLAADLSGLSGIAGVLSPGALKGMLVTFDHSRKQIRVEAGSLPAPDGQTTFEWPATERLPTVPITIGDVEIPAHLDTGAPGGLKLPQLWSDSLELDGPLTRIASARTVGGVIEQQVGKLRTVPRLGAYELSRDVVFQSGVPIANLGVDVLRRFVVTLDWGARRLRLIDVANPRRQS